MTYDWSEHKDCNLGMLAKVVDYYSGEQEMSAQLEEGYIWGYRIYEGSVDEGDLYYNNIVYTDKQEAQDIVDGLNKKYLLKYGHKSSYPYEIEELKIKFPVQQ